MKLKITSIQNRGDAAKEYVMLEALADIDVGDYLLGDTTYLQDGSVSNKLRHTFWFPNKKVRKGEYVSLWTGKGKATLGETKDGSPVHRFYWNLATAVWNDDKDCAVLIETSAWSMKRV